MTAANEAPASGPASNMIVERLDRGLRTITGGMAMLGVLALIMAIAVVIGDIVWRRLGGGSFIGSVDVTQLSVMIAVSWSIPYAFATDAHVTVDLLSQSFSPTANRILEAGASLAAAAVVGLLCWLSLGRAREIAVYGDVSQDLAIPMVWFWSSLVAGLALSVVVCLVRAALILMKRSV